jgi:pantetheine-phosphate adenylyltransferase
LTIALFPGFFDPVTNGHLDIARRSATLFDHVVVGVADSAITHSSTLFTTEERVQLFAEAVKGEPKIEVMPYTGLTVDFARKHGATVLIRSMRGNTDFESEFDQALMNRRMAPQIESVYLIASLEYLFISGTRIREVAALGYNVSDFVPAHVNEALRKKFAKA